jgi:transposase
MTPISRSMNDSERAEIVAKVGEPFNLIDFAARKKKVVELLAAGFSKPQIARYFGVSQGTIRYWLIGRDQRRVRIAAERAYEREQVELQARIAAEKAASVNPWSLLESLRKSQA